MDFLVAFCECALINLKPRLCLQLFSFFSTCLDDVVIDDTYVSD